VARAPTVAGSPLAASLQTAAARADGSSHGHARAPTRRCALALARRACWALQQRRAANRRVSCVLQAAAPAPPQSRARCELEDGRMACTLHPV
jgi:hypothetical protein